MLKPLDDKEQDIAFATGFLQEWLSSSPEPIKQYFNTLVDGIEYYRQEKYLLVQQDYEELLQKYNSLAASSAQYLGRIQELEQQNRELLIETQRDLYKED